MGRAWTMEKGAGLRRHRKSWPSEDVGHKIVGIQRVFQVDDFFVRTALGFARDQGSRDFSRVHDMFRTLELDGDPVAHSPLFWGLADA